jgi:ribosome-binding factor A
MRSFRADKMGSFIRGLVGDVIANKLSDPRVSRFTSVTRVEVSGDLQLAKVYVSVMGSPAEQQRTLRGLQHATGHIQRLVGRELSVRHVPEIRFLADDSIKGSARTFELIDEVLKNEGESAAPSASDEPDPDENRSEAAPP